MLSVSVTGKSDTPDIFLHSVKKESVSVILFNRPIAVVLSLGYVLSYLLVSNHNKASVL